MDVKKISVAINHSETQAITLTIGKLIVNFGALEYETYLWLACLKGSINGIDDNELFKSRVDRLLKNLMQVSHARSNDAVKAWKGALEIAKFRNQIVHNPIFFGWNNKDEVGEPDFLMVLDVKVGLKNGGKEAIVTHSEIKQQVDGIGTLVQELREIRGLIWSD